jgi:1-hydroxycarotenoid 3,4-desaturase
MTLTALDCLARHAWEDGGRLDLYADAGRNAQAIGEFAGAAAARGYERFAARSKKIFETLDAPFMQAQQPGLFGLARNAGPGQAGALMRLSPFATLWDEIRTYFPNPRLRQLFARYATYCGSSPFSAPATLMLIAHAEQCGVFRIEGGMYRLAEAVSGLAAARGAVFRYDARVAEILVRNGQVSGVKLSDGEVIEADAVIANADLAALDAGRLGAAAQTAVKGLMRGAKRSLSALTWGMTGAASGFDLAHHNVFFADDYPAEFAAIGAGRLPDDPTIYLCAPDGADGAKFCLVNAPAIGDSSGPTLAEEQACLNRVLEKLRRCGLELRPEEMATTGPRDFETMFPASGGALYGRALTGWRDSFTRPGAKTRLPGLYLAGGAIHPGPGLPMAALSGRLAAEQLLADLASTSTFRAGAMPGGMWMRSAMTAPKP